MNKNEMNEHEQIMFEHILMTLDERIMSAETTDDVKRFIEQERKRAEIIFQATLTLLDKKTKQIDFLEGGGFR